MWCLTYFPSPEETSTSKCLPYNGYGPRGFGPTARSSDDSLPNGTAST